MDAALRDAPHHDAQLTDQQRAALATRSVSVALAAGAGCGKTFVLTERFLAHLEPPRPGERAVDLGQIVAITFTERAAREMRGRIRTAAHQRLARALPDEAAHWLAVVRRMDAARISTIHAFCASLLRSQAVEARLDPRFAVLEESQSAALLAAVTDDVLRESLAKRDPAVLDVLSIIDLGRLREHLATLVKSRHRFQIEPWLDVTPEELVARWEQVHRTEVVPALLDGFQQLPAFTQLQEIIATVVPPAGDMAERFEELREHCPRLSLPGEGGVALEAIHAAARVERTKSKWTDQEAYLAFKSAADAVRKKVEGLRDKLPFDADDAVEAARLGLCVLRIAAPVVVAFENRKHELGCLDFDDLLIHTRQLLCGPDRGAIRGRVADGIEVLLVDEFQDTDRVQVELVEALCGDRLTRGKLFFVGDHKQSIYRFRGAEPDVFHALRQRMHRSGRLPLSENFRSQPAILDFVNGLFQTEFENYEPLVAHRAQVAPVPAVEFLWATPAADETSLKVSKGDLREIEADWIARRLRELIDSREPLIWTQPAAGSDAPTARPAKQGDVALLFRAMKDVEMYEQALRKWGFDYYLVGGRAFYAQQEIFDLLNLLKALASPADVLSLCGALRSPLFALTDESLFWLAQNSEGIPGGLRDSLRKGPPADLDPQQTAQVRLAAATIADLRAEADRLGVAELISRALARTGYDAVLLAEFLGERKLANLHKLIAQAREFDRAGAFTLSDFIRQLAEQVSREPHEAMAATHPESTDVVRLMTIHQAKGLEFPIVVVPDLQRQPGGNRAQAACDPRLGPLVKPPGSECKTTGLDLYLAAEAAAEVAERARLFYVATTRAADFLILSSGVENLAQAKAGTWRELLAKSFDLLEGTYQGRPLTQGRTPLARVITERPEVAVKPAGKGDSTGLVAVIDAVRELAAAGGGEVPPGVAAVPPDLAARRVFSFSSLSGVLQVEEPLGGDLLDGLTTAEPVELARAAGEGPELGILVHAALAQWCERPVHMPGDCRALVERVAALSPAVEPRHVEAAVELVARFAAGPRAAEVRQAKQRHTELEFLLAWPAPVGDPLVIRGFIDCLYEDAGGRWHVLDFKTHPVPAEAVPRVAAGYRLQMLTYALAVEESLGASPDEIVLHFLHPGREQLVPLDEEARVWTRSQIELRIAALLRATGT